MRQFQSKLKTDMSKSDFLVIPILIENIGILVFRRGFDSFCWLSYNFLPNILTLSGLLLLFFLCLSFSFSLALALSLYLSQFLSLSLSLASSLVMFISCKNMLPWDMSGVGIPGIFNCKCWSVAEQYLSHSLLVA